MALGFYQRAFQKLTSNVCLVFLSTLDWKHLICVRPTEVIFVQKFIIKLFVFVHHVIFHVVIYVIYRCLIFCVTVVQIILNFRRLFINKCVFVQGFLRLYQERVCDVYRCLLFLHGQNGESVHNRGQFWIFCSQSRFSSRDPNVKRSHCLRLQSSLSLLSSPKPQTVEDSSASPCDEEEKRKFGRYLAWVRRKK